MSRLIIVLFAVFSFGITMADSPRSLAAEIVHYQCKEWKAKHIHDSEKAETISKTLKKLGVEVKEAKHNGHIDVKYRCVKERQLSVKSHEEALKWEKWLKEFGFKAYHTH